MWKKLAFCLTILFSLTFSCYAKDWVFYGTSDDGIQLFYNADLVDLAKDRSDNRDTVLVWIGAQDPKKKFVDTLFYVAFKDNPQKFAYLAEIHCTRNGEITEFNTFKTPTWENTQDSNLMEFLYQQTLPIAKKQSELLPGTTKANNYMYQTVVQSSINGIKNSSDHNPAIGRNTASVPITSDYVGNSRTMKFHVKSCRWAKKIGAGNRMEFDSREEAVEQGYVPCRVYNP